VHLAVGATAGDADFGASSQDIDVSNFSGDAVGSALLNNFAALAWVLQYREEIEGLLTLVRMLVQVSLGERIRQFRTPRKTAGLPILVADLTRRLPNLDVRVIPELSQKLITQLVLRPIVLRIAAGLFHVLALLVASPPPTAL